MEAVALVQFEDGAEVDVGLARAGLHFDREVRAHARPVGRTIEEFGHGQRRRIIGHLDVVARLDLARVGAERVGIDLEAIGKIITEKKISIGVIDHHTLQVERPEEVAASIRAALKHIPAERLMVSSDCGMGREGMSRRHAYYKIVSMVLGTNIVRKELGLPLAECLAADPRYSLVVPTK